MVSGQAPIHLFHRDLSVRDTQHFVRPFTLIFGHAFVVAHPYFPVLVYPLE